MIYLVMTVFGVILMGSIVYFGFFVIDTKTNLDFMTDEMRTKFNVLERRKNDVWMSFDEKRLGVLEQRVYELEEEMELLVKKRELAQHYFHYDVDLKEGEEGSKSFEVTFKHQPICSVENLSEVYPIIKAHAMGANTIKF